MLEPPESEPEREIWVSGPQPCAEQHLKQFANTQWTKKMDFKYQLHA